MRVVIPQDEFWAELWAKVDKDVLHKLTSPCDLGPYEAPVVEWAYEAYGRILYQLPQDVRQLVFSHVSGWADRIPGQQELPGHRLYRADGRQLTPMYVIDIPDRDRDALVAFQRHLHSEEPSDLKDLVPQNLIDVYSRALGVLTLAPPTALVDALTPARGSGDEEIVLSADAQAAYDTHRDRIIHEVSGRNADLMTCHHILYA